MSKLESVEVNPQLDCVIIEYSFVNKIHGEIMAAEEVAFLNNLYKIDEAIETVAKKYGAKAYLKEKTAWYLFRFKTEQDKLAFILKNV